MSLAPNLGGLQGFTMKKNILFVTLAIIVAFLAQNANAAQMKLMKSQEKAFFAEDANGFFKGLTLKTKVYIFNSRDSLKCGSSLKRGLQTLNYFCKIDLPDAANITKLHKMETHNVVKVTHGRLKKKVYIKVSENGKYVKFSTEFDETGIDWDVSKFNDEFYAVYAKSAQNILAKAMMKKGLKIQTIDKK